MRTLPAGLAAHLSGRATTLAHAWILRRPDGVAMGFTDHDRPLTVDGVACEPASGFDRSAAVSHAGLAVGDEEVAGALSSDRITDADLSAGRWDGAAVAVHLVNWADPAETLLLRTGTIGEVVRSDGAFRAEIRGPLARLDRPTGRRYGFACDAEFGDARCGVPTGPWTEAATVLAGSDAVRLRVAGLDHRAIGHFARGRMTVGAGDMAGLEAVVDDHLVDAAGVTLVLWRPLPAGPATGTALTVVAGCDKLFQTCRSKFANAENFRGFPHIPGRDFVFGVARADRDNDGGVLFR